MKTHAKLFFVLSTITMILLIIPWNTFAAPLAPDVRLSQADIIINSESSGDNVGASVSSIGDVNGDGLPDFAIGAPRNDSGGHDAGKVYIFFGKVDGWGNSINLSQADASFIGERKRALAGYAISGVGDVNHDGFDDFLIGAPYDGESGSKAGQIYLILGKATGWAMDAPLSQASASFVGERAFDRAGQGLARLGDINNDGYDDFAIGAPGADDGGSSAGKVYIILGKSSGWATNVSLSTAHLSYWGETMGDRAGLSIAGVKNTVGSGSIGLLVGAPGNDEGDYYNSGKSYLVLLKGSDIEP